MKKRRGTLHSKRLRDYRYTDKKKGYENDLTLEGVRALIQLPCHYCSRPNAGGLDRLDNNKGHTYSNIVSCCSTCNYILSTLPYKAKLELREPLRKIYEQDLLKDWQPIFMVPSQPKKEEPNPHIGSDFDDFLKEEDIFEDVYPSFNKMENPPVIVEINEDLRKNKNEIL